MANQLATFQELGEIAAHIREKLEEKKYILLFAYNGTGKTRLSMEFKELGKNGDDRDTLYFNAFTEDLFNWDNDLTNDSKRLLRMNRNSRFFDGLEELEMENRIAPVLARYADFNFYIDYTNWEIIFFRETDIDGAPIPIKVSRGEENIFIWCFFLVVAQLALDSEDGAVYSWVKYIYIDDPISSLDDNNAIAVAHYLAQLFKVTKSNIKVALSSHHTLFFNVMCNEWGNAVKYYLGKNDGGNGYILKPMYGDTARFYHVAMLRDLKKAADSGDLYTYHFNILRNLMEKTATFHGYTDFSHFISVENDDEEKTLLTRLVQVLNHGGYSLLEPIEMLPENKSHFRKILDDFLKTYSFNQGIFS